MALYYANGREVFTPDVWSITVTSGGSLNAGTYYFSLQGRNRIGLNKLLISDAVVIPQNGKVEISVNSSALQSGEEWLCFVIGSSTTPTESSFVQLATLPVLDPNNQNTLFSFPRSVTFDSNEHIKLSTTVTTLPTTNLINGMLRGYSTNGIIYELDLYDRTSVDDGTLVKVVSGNRWKARPTFSTYVSSIFVSGGCRQDIRTIDTSNAISVLYNPDGSTSTPVSLWLTGDNNVIERGLRVNVDLFVGSQNMSQKLDGKALLTFLGFVNLNTGEIRTTRSDGSLIEGIGLNQTFNANYPVLTLEDDLQTNEAYSFNLAFRFSSAEWVGLLPEGANLKALANFSAVSGVFQELSAFTGDCILNKGKLRRIVPNTGLSVKALSGSGIIQNYSFPLVNEQNIFGLAPNTDNQKIAINGNGSVYYSPTVEIPAGSVLRAIVSTKKGVTNPALFSNSIYINQDGGIRFTVVYPTAIRDNYPDVIAENTQGLFNVPRIVVYIRKLGNGEVKAFDKLIVVPGVSQTFIIVDWSKGITISQIPQTLDTAFGLFDIPQPTNIQSISQGNFEADDYQITIAFEYDGNQVTKINHSTNDGCVVELRGSISELFDHLVDYENPHNVTTDQIGAVDLDSNQSITGPKTFENGFLSRGTTFFEGNVQALNVATSNVIGFAISGNSQFSFLARTDGLIQWGNGINPPDTNLYREGNSFLRTDNNFGIGGRVVTNSMFDVFKPVSDTDNALVTYAPNCPYYVFRLTTSGKMMWGNPNGQFLTDTYLYRDGINSLKTDGDFTVGRDLIVAGNNSATQIKGVVIDDSGKAAGKVLKLNEAGDRIIYETVSLSGSAIAIFDEGAPITSATTSINFTGSGVQATNSNEAVTVNIPGTASTNFDAEAIDDRVSSLLQAGTGISLTYNDTANTLLISSTTSGSAIAVQDEGATITTSCTTLNFTGSSIQADDNAGVVTVNISSGSSGTFDIDSLLTDFDTGQILLDDNGNVLVN